MDEGLFGPEPEEQTEIEDAIEVAISAATGSKQGALFQKGSPEKAAVDGDRMKLRDIGDEFKRQLFGSTAAVPANVEVGKVVDQDDLDMLSRFIRTPRSWSKKFPAINRLIEKGVNAEKKMSVQGKSFNKELDRLRKPINKDEWAQLSGILFSGDAEAKTYTDKELDGFKVSQKVKTAYHKARVLMDKIGRFVEQHERKMKLKMFQRRSGLLKKMAQSREMSKADFHKIYGQRAKIMAKLRNGDEDPVALAAEIDKLTEKVHGTEPTEEYAEWATEADAIEKRLESTKVRRREGYIPHKFFGTWRVFREGEENENGEKQWEHLAGKHGFFPTRATAVRAAVAHAKASPDDNLKVAPVQFEFEQAETTQLSDASYRKFKARVGDMLEVSGEDLDDLVHKVARLPFRRRVAGFSKFRSGAKGFSKDLDRVLTSHIGEVVRYVHLDELKYDAINTMEREGLSRHRQSANQPTLQKAVRRLGSGT